MTKPPGSYDARQDGCSCPTVENEHGKGYMGSDEYVISKDCPMHGFGENDA